MKTPKPARQFMNRKIMRNILRNKYGNKGMGNYWRNISRDFRYKKDHPNMPAVTKQSAFKRFLKKNVVGG